MRWPQINHFEVSSSLILCNNEPFLNLVVMYKKSGFYITYNDQISNWTEQKLQSACQSQTCSLQPHSKKKKNSCSRFGGLLPISSIKTFWILANPLHLESRLSISVRWTGICQAYSQHLSAERAQFSVTISCYRSHNQCFKSWTNWAMEFCLVCHIHPSSHQLATTSWSILTTFCRETDFTTSRSRKCFPRVHWILKQEFVCCRNK